jgi:hypothetical protein
VPSPPDQSRRDRRQRHNSVPRRSAVDSLVQVKDPAKGLECRNALARSEPNREVRNTLRLGAACGIRDWRKPAGPATGAPLPFARVVINPRPATTSLPRRGGLSSSDPGAIWPFYCCMRRVHCRQCGVVGRRGAAWGSTPAKRFTCIVWGIGRANSFPTTFG